MPAGNRHFSAAVVDADTGIPVPLPRGVTPARARGTSRAATVSQARRRFANATGISARDLARLGYAVRCTEVERTTEADRG